MSAARRSQLGSGSRSEKVAYKLPAAASGHAAAARAGAGRSPRRRSPRPCGRRTSGGWRSRRSPGARRGPTCCIESLGVRRDEVDVPHEPSCSSPASRIRITPSRLEEERTAGTQFSGPNGAEVLYETGPDRVVQRLHLHSTGGPGRRGPPVSEWGRKPHRPLSGSNDITLVVLGIRGHEPLVGGVLQVDGSGWTCWAARARLAGAADLGQGRAFGPGGGTMDPHERSRAGPTSGCIQSQASRWTRPQVAEAAEAYSQELAQPLKSFVLARGGSLTAEDRARPTSPSPSPVEAAAGAAYLSDAAELVAHVPYGAGSSWAPPTRSAR